MMPEREALSNNQIRKDKEALATIEYLGKQSLTNGDEIEPQLRKVFVGGLPHNLNHSVFKSYFLNFGDIEDCVIL